MGQHFVTSGAVEQTPLREDLTHFECWALRMLRCELENDGPDVWKVTLPESLRDDWSGEGILHFQAGGNGSQARGNGTLSGDESDLGVADVLEISPASKLFRWTVERLRDQDFVHAAPQQQPVGVHEITPQLFAPFAFDGGHIHLAGCALEDRPFIRLTLPGEETDPEPTLRHHFQWPSGEAVDDELVAQLALDELRPLDTRPAQRNSTALKDAIDRATTTMSEQGNEVLAVTVVWCKYAEGKIAFEAAEDTVHVPFSGWAKLIAAGLAKPEPYDCPLTNQQAYELAVTDDGRIAAAAGITACEESGRRMLTSELAKCAATGKLVESKLLQACRVSGEKVLASAIVNCAQCGQGVSKNSLKGGRCSACRSLAPVRKDDPRMARLLDEYPKLDSWPRWRIAETDAVYVLLATSWLRQLSIVVDKNSLEVSHAATSGRLLTNWTELSDAQREELLEA